MYKQIKINITKAQLDNALKGKPVRFNAEQIGQGPSYLSLHPSNVKIVEKAAMRGKGCTIPLSAGELMATAEDMGGQGIFGDIWKGLKSGYKWVKKNVIDSDIYQKGLKPIVKGLVDQGVNIASQAYPQAAPVLKLASDKIGKETSAFGLRSRMTKSKKIEMLRGKGLYLS
jgi:hypothetical protein